MQQRCHGWRKLQESSLATVLGVCKGHVSFISSCTYLVSCRLCRRLHVSPRHLKPSNIACTDTSDFLHAELLRTVRAPMCRLLGA